MIDALPLLLAPEGYQISRSVRLRSSASAYFNRTPASAGNRKTFTISYWIKRGALTGTQYLFQAGSGTTEATWFSAGAFDTETIGAGTWTTTGGVTTAVFRDPSAWYHVVIAVDTTQATATNRCKIYVNGVQQAQSTPTLTLNADLAWNNSGVVHYIGARVDSGPRMFFDGYLTEINSIDGQALTPSSFGAYNAYGVWSPMKYNGTYGTNGFYLNFSDNSGATATTIGKDSSGNGNNWTPNNISVTAGATYDSMLDVPTPWPDGGNGRGNYAVINPLAAVQLSSLTNGNLTAVASQTLRGGGNATIAVRTGQWYWEHNVGTSGEFFIFGIRNTSGSLTDFPGADSNGYGYYGQNGNKYTGGSATAYGATFASGDVIGVAFDADAGTLTFYKNNVSQGTAFSSIPSGDWFPAIGDGSTTISGSTVNVNFGQRPFSYTPPSGFRALNTQNLPTPTILKGNQFFDVNTWTGNGSTQSIVNAGGMQPDLVWIKSRSTTWWNHLIDSVRGPTKQLYSNATDTEGTVTDALTSFNSNGFSMGLNVGVNQNAATYVGWQWKEGATQGFDIVTYTGDGTSNRQISHSLGVTPAMIIVKVRSTTNNWRVWHQRLTGSTYYLGLNQTAAEATSSTVFNGQSSTTFTVGNDPSVNVNAGTFVAYLFSEVAGFSRFGSYTGNGSADGTFVFTGFRPRYVMFKRSDAVDGWIVFDTARNPQNLVTAELFPHNSSAEGDAAVNSRPIDILSNGFKVRGTNSAVNTNGGTYIFAAFSEVGFKYALAR